MSHFDKGTFGFVYLGLTHGDKPWFLNQCIRSIHALRAYNLAPVTLFTDRVKLASVALRYLDNVKILDMQPKISPFKLKVKAQLLCTYERQIFIDSDTYPLSDLSDLFNLLKSKDFFIANDAERSNIKDSNLDPKWPYPIVKPTGAGYNTGFFGFKKTEQVVKFINLWLQKVSEIDDSNLIPGQGDQKYFNQLMRDGTFKALGFDFEVLDNKVFNALYNILPLLSDEEKCLIKMLHTKELPNQIIKEYPQFSTSKAIIMASKARSI